MSAEPPKPQAKILYVPPGPLNRQNCRIAQQHDVWIYAYSSPIMPHGVTKSQKLAALESLLYRDVSGAPQTPSKNSIRASRSLKPTKLPHCSATRRLDLCIFLSNNATRCHKITETRCAGVTFVSRCQRSPQTPSKNSIRASRSLKPTKLPHCSATRRLDLCISLSNNATRCHKITETRCAGVTFVSRCQRSPQTPSKNSIRASRSLKPTKLPHCSATRRLDLCIFLSNNATRCHKTTETRCAGVTFVSRCQRSPQTPSKNSIRASRSLKPTKLPHCSATRRLDLCISLSNNATRCHKITETRCAGVTFVSRCQRSPQTPSKNSIRASRSLKPTKLPHCSATRRLDLCISLSNNATRCHKITETRCAGVTFVSRCQRSPQTPSKNSIRASRSLKPTKLPHCSATRRLDLCISLSNNATRCHKITETRCAGVTFVSRCQRSPQTPSKNSIRASRSLKPTKLPHCSATRRLDLCIFLSNNATRCHKITETRCAGVTFVSRCQRSPQTPSKNSIRASRSLKPTKLPHCSATRRLDLCISLSNNATRCHKITETRCAGVTFVSRCQRSPQTPSKN